MGGNFEQNPVTNAEDTLVQKQLLLAVVATILTLAPKAQTQATAPTLGKMAEFELPGPPGKRFDYLTIDSEDHYLISAHLAAGQTYVIDLRTNCGHTRCRRSRVCTGIEEVLYVKRR